MSLGPVHLGTISKVVKLDVVGDADRLPGVAKVLALDSVHFWSTQKTLGLACTLHDYRAELFASKSTRHAVMSGLVTMATRHHLFGGRHGELSEFTLEKLNLRLTLVQTLFKNRVSHLTVATFGINLVSKTTRDTTKGVHFTCSEPH
jgi:hypothetical protein